MLCHLVYVSTATRPMRDEDLVELLAEARKHNEENDITGMLLHKDGRFLQLLEGHEENVQAAFDVIKQDERHYRVELLWLRYVQFRDFPDWTMGFHNVDELDPTTLKGFTPFLDGDFRYENFLKNSTEVHQLLLAFKGDPSAFP
jgi:hypothetical protein